MNTFETWEAMKPMEPSNQIAFFPDWGHKWPLWGPVALRPEHLGLSTDLERRLAEWVRVWQEELDPVIEIRWPSTEMGEAWIAEGEALCNEVQEAVKKRRIMVIPRFSEFAPSRDV